MHTESYRPPRLRSYPSMEGSQSSMPFCQCMCYSNTSVLQLDLQETASGASSMFRTVTIYVSLSMGSNWIVTADSL